MDPLSSEIISVIKGLQGGKATPDSPQKFDPKTTKRGVSIFALSVHFEDYRPERIARLLGELCDSGQVNALDPDVDGLISFYVPLKA